MLRIRFQRVGLKRQPAYRIVVTDSRKARTGASIEVIGHHNPRTRPSTDIVKLDRALYWLSVGAKPSEAAERLLKRLGAIDLVARYHKGEAMEALIAEGEAALAKREPVSPRTSYPSPVGAAPVPAPAPHADAAAEEA